MAAETGVVRGFWHGVPPGPYQLMCLASFVLAGHRVEIFTYDPALLFPDWVVRRDANDILPASHVMRYRTGFGTGSPALHSNLFRLVMLHKLGGWWIDMDILLLNPDLPPEPIFIALADVHYETLNNSVMKFPAGHPMLADAIAACRKVAESEAAWGQTGPLLLTRMVDAHRLRGDVRPASTAYPVPWREVGALFDPARRDDIEAMCAGANFVHLFNEIWRGAGIPPDLAPPPASYLDACLRRYLPEHRFAAAMRLDDVTRWIENRREKIMRSEELAAARSEYASLLSEHQALRSRLGELTYFELLLTRPRLSRLIRSMGKQPER